MVIVMDTVMEGKEAEIEMTVIMRRNVMRKVQVRVPLPEKSPLLLRHPPRESRPPPVPVLKLPSVTVHLNLMERNDTK